MTSVHMFSKILVPGFQFAGIHAGIKDDARKKDLTLIYSEEPSTLVDGVFTKNRVCAAPVILCRKVVRRGMARLIVINSGIANACTGSRGFRDAIATQREAARLFHLAPSRVLVSSTGKIGDFLPMNRLIPGIGKAKKFLSSSRFLDAAKGIMTTDQFPKFGAVRGSLGGKRYSIAVMTKGAGMLRPNMATLLTYVLTDLKISRGTLKKLFRSAVETTLNRVTVDGDTSTNDSVIMMANGRAGNSLFTAGSKTGKKIGRELEGLLAAMARKVALDGEGATKCCLVKIRGARNNGDAEKAAYAIGNSPLVKTALFGCDPNWGRIMAAVGYSGASVKPEKIKISIGPHRIVARGIGIPGVPVKKVSRYMERQNIAIVVDLGLGSGSHHIFMSDLTYDYIHLNAEYHT